MPRVNGYPCSLKVSEYYSGNRSDLLEGTISKVIIEYNNYFFFADRNILSEIIQTTVSPTEKLGNNGKKNTHA